MPTLITLAEQHPILSGLAVAAVAYLPTCGLLWAWFRKDLRP